MANRFILHFENMPRTTAQMKGECIRYKFVNDKRVPYVHHFKKANVSALRSELEWRLKQFRPKAPSERPVRLFLVLYFDVKDRSKWGKPKDTRPDCDNFAKELIDAMTASGFWKDDALIADLHIKKYYAEKASIYVEWEETDNE